MDDLRQGFTFLRRLSGYLTVLAHANRFGGLVTLFILQLAINTGTVALIVAGRLSEGIVAEASVIMGLETPALSV
jgi:hypothetical protein